MAATNLASGDVVDPVRPANLEGDMAMGLEKRQVPTRIVELGQLDHAACGHAAGRGGRTLSLDAHTQPRCAQGRGLVVLLTTDALRVARPSQARTSHRRRRAPRTSPCCGTGLR